VRHRLNNLNHRIGTRLNSCKYRQTASGTDLMAPEACIGEKLIEPVKVAESNRLETLIRNEKALQSDPQTQLKSISLIAKERAGPQVSELRSSRKVNICGGFLSVCISLAFQAMKTVKGNLSLESHQPCMCLPLKL
jgi:hypothetical protein